MSLLIESIRLVDGKFHNLFYHEQRMNHSLKVLCGSSAPVDLHAFLEKVHPPDKGLYKCRITYDDDMQEVEFLPYTPASIKTLKIVESNTISYEHKYKDRKKIDKLYAQRESCDDILIIKDDQVTDASFANIVFRNRDGWFTPWSALLRGTMRQFLLEREIIKTETISKQDIRLFQRFKLINAMVGFDGPEIDVSNIILS